MKLRIYSETCCEICNEIIHNHFDCPSCKKQYASTSIYGYITDENIGDVLACEECGARFELLNKNSKFYSDEYEWKQLE